MINATFVTGARKSGKAPSAVDVQRRWAVWTSVWTVAPALRVMWDRSVPVSTLGQGSAASSGPPVMTSTALTVAPARSQMIEIWGQSVCKCCMLKTNFNGGLFWLLVDVKVMFLNVQRVCWTRLIQGSRSYPEISWIVLELSVLSWKFVFVMEFFPLFQNSIIYQF